jgi:choice-of-anchor B domain-containing protein
MRPAALTSSLILVLLVLPAGAANAHPDHDESDQKGPPTEQSFTQRQLAVSEAPQPEGFASCRDGAAGRYACSNVDLLAHLPAKLIGHGYANDLWGWEDPDTGANYALIGHEAGTTFVDISTPTDPVVVGVLPTQTRTSRWHDVKVLGNYAVVVSEARGHGMQVFDLTSLRETTGPATRYEATAHYDGFGNAHNVAINEQSGHAIAVGTSTCSGGLHMVDLSDPLRPLFAGCFGSDGYTHDVHCVRYIGPDVTYQGRDLCFAANEDTLTIVDVTTPSSPVLISRSSYPGVGYTHQGWLTDDHRWFLADDEYDERIRRHGTRTYLWDLADLNAPPPPQTHTADTVSTDHNQYVTGGFSYQANYRAGLRILDVKRAASGILTEAGFFDIVPGSDARGYSGAWTAYPFHGGGLVTVSGIEQGLFVLRFNGSNRAGRARSIAV